MRAYLAAFWSVEHNTDTHSTVGREVVYSVFAENKEDAEKKARKIGKGMDLMFIMEA